MPAWDMQNKAQFQGQIVDWEVNYAAPYSGELYFTLVENVRQRSYTTVADFRRVYINSFAASVSAGDGLYSTGTMYHRVEVDAPKVMIELFNHIKEGDGVLRNTIVAFNDALMPGMKKDVIVTGRAHKNKTGHVVGFADLIRWNVMLDEGGEIIKCDNTKLRVLHPRTYVTGKVACADCLNIVDKVIWVTQRDGQINRPMCGMCIDYYLDTGVLGDRVIWENFEGPFIYDEHQPATCLKQPSMPPLHRVLQEQNSPRTRQTRGQNLRQYGRGRRV